MDIIQRIRYEVDNKQVSQTANVVEDLVKANKDLQQTAGQSLDGATTGLKNYEGAVKRAGRELDNNRGKVSAWQRATNAGGKVARRFGDEINIAGRSLTEVSDLLQGAGKRVGLFSSQAAKGGATAARGFSTARVAAIAFQASIGIIIGIIAIFVAAMSRSQRVIDAVEDTMSVLTAAFDVFADRAALVGEAVVALFQGDVIGAANAYADAHKGIISELEDETRAALENTQALRAVRREQTLLTAERAKANQIIKEQGLISEDVTRSAEERAAAARKAFETESEFIQKSTAALRKELQANLAIGVDVSEVERIVSSTDDAAERFEALRAIAGNSLTTDTGVEGIIDIYKELQEQQAASLETQTTLNNRINTIDQQAQAAYLKALEERRKAEQELGQVQLQIRDALRASANLEGEELIEQNRKVALEQIAEVEKVARARFAAARVEFDAEEEFAELRKRANAAADTEIADFRIEQQKQTIDELLKEELAYIDLISVSGDARLSLEEFQAQERIAAQRRSLQELRTVVEAEGGNVLEIDVQIAKLDAEAVGVITSNNDRIRDEALKGIQDRENIEKARVDLIRESSREELSVEQDKERQKLVITLNGIRERLEVLRKAGATEAELTLLTLQGDRIQQQIDDLENIRLDPIERLVGKIQDAFKLDDEALAEITGQLGAAIENITAGVESLREAELSRIDTQIEAARERADELRTLLEQEQQDQADGFANNVALYESALAEQERIEQENVNARLEIQRRAANQQLAIEAAQQAASLTTAAAKLIASEASKGLVGLVIGIGALGLLFSTIARARANAAQFATVPTLREGTDFVEGVLIGPSHEGGGIPGLYNKNGNRYAVEMEGGERVFSRKHNKQFSPLFDAIQGNRVNGMSDILTGVPDRVFNGALGTPVIKIDPSLTDNKKATPKTGSVHFIRISDKKLMRIDETGPVRRIETINVN